MFKRITVLLLAFTMILAFTACSSDEPEDENDAIGEIESTDVVDGGWAMAENEAAALPEDVQTAFDKAYEQFTGSDLKPVAYIASQVVAGTNYMILCEETTATEKPETSYKMVVVYADLEGNAEFASINDFEYVAYTVGDSEEISAENLAGGWSVPDDAAGSAVPDDAKEAFDKAVGAFTGAEIVPLALLGNQIVAGTNYAFICKSTLTTEEPVTGIQVVTVYADLEDNAEIIGISTVDPADFNK